MPVCLNCESQDFYIESGVYLCSVCQVVSQEAVQEVIDHYETPQAAPAIKTKASQNRPKKIIDKGKPWYTSEAYQVILKSQVRALIGLGCTPELFDITKQIWFKYVHKIGIAVIDPSLPTNKKPIDSTSSFRDRYLTGILGKRYLQHELYPDLRHKFSLKMKLPIYTQSGRKREFGSSSLDSNDCEFENFNYKRSRKCKKKQKKKLIPTVDNDKAWRSDEEWYSLASNPDSSDSDENFQNKMQKVIKTVPGTKKQNISYNLRTSVKHLNLHVLLSIVHVALQWCNETVTVGDLLLWIRQGYLPYIDSLKCLLPHMKLSNFDVNHIKHPILPCYESVIFKTKQMVDFLEMPQNLPNLDIHKLVLRYIVEMNLPLSLMSFIDTFIKVSLFEYKRKRGANVSIYAPEAAALALIVIGFKILFGLNDNREWGVPEPCNTHDECRPFSWQEWANYHLERAAEVKKNPRNCFESSDVEAIDDLHAYSEHFKNVIVRSSGHGKEINTSLNTKKLKDIAKAKAWPFMKLSDLQQSNKEMEKHELLREYPYIHPRPSPESDMSNRCIDQFMRMLKKQDCSYVRYTDRFSRVEDCFLSTISSYAYRFRTATVYQQPAPETHLSYDFFLSVASSISLVDKVFIHSMTQTFESRYLSPILDAKKEQLFSSTSWSQSRMFSDCVVRDARQKPKSRAADQEEDDFT